MTDLKLYGSLTSPYVRRVRIVAIELGVDLDWVDTATERGQGALRELNPLWLVPTLTIDDEVVFDSTVITHRLIADFGSAQSALAAADANDSAVNNFNSVIDGALDSLINAFYLSKEGATGTQFAYLQKQHDRAAAALTWLEERIDNATFAPTDALSLPEIALITALDWMRLRQTYPIEKHPKLCARTALYAGRPSVRATAPPA
jgi:glutathione S-transferase